jgi:hypothetical protein
MALEVGNYEYNMIIVLQEHLKMILSVQIQTIIQPPSTSVVRSLYLYSCCSHLEHRAPVKRFVSLQFLNIRQSIGLPGRVIIPSQGRYLHTNKE